MPPVVRADEPLSVRARLLLLALVWLGLNLVTAERSPTVSMDEPFFVESAFNLSHGHGFVIDGWNGEDDSRAPLAHAPMYTVVLSLWMRLVPFNLASLRALNYFLVLAAGFLLLATIRCSVLWKHETNSLLLLASLLCAHSVTFVYRCIRYDAFGLLMLAVAVYGATHRTRWLSLLITICTGMLLPWAGLHLMVFGAAFSLLFLISEGKVAVRRLLPFWGSVVAGTGLMLVIWARLGMLSEFLLAIGRSSIVAAPTVAASPYNQLFSKWHHVPWAYIADPTSLVLMFALVLALVLGWRRVPAPVFRFGVAALSTTLLLPVTMELLYRYKIYHTWAVAVVLILALSAIRSSTPKGERVHLLATSALLFAIVAGFPLRLALTVLEWRARDHAPVDRLIERNIGPRDWVYADFSAYFAVRSRARAVALPQHLFEAVEFLPTERQRKGVSVLVLGRETLGDVSLFPGEWREVDHVTTGETANVFGLRKDWGARPYNLGVYRRVR